MYLALENFDLPFVENSKDNFSPEKVHLQGVYVKTIQIERRGKKM